MMENTSNGQKSELRKSQANKKGLFEHFINYSQQNGNLLQKFNPKQIASLISIHQLQRWSKLYENSNNEHSLMSIQEFVGLFSSGIPHQKDQTLYLILSLIDMYRIIENKSKNRYSAVGNISFCDISDYLCQKILGCETDLKLQIRCSQSMQTSLGKKSPCIRHLYSESLPHINKQHINKEKSLKNQINNLFYSHKIDRIIVLTSFSSKIQLYDKSLKLRSIIHPKLSKKYKNQPIIGSFAYSEEQQRIGCVIGGCNIVFWEICDNFQTEKVMESVKADRIYYLKMFKVWVTTKTNVLSFWDIQKQRQHYTLRIASASQISHLCQVKKICSIIVSVTLKSCKKQLHLYSLSQTKAKLLSKVQLDQSGCHTLHVNNATQTIIQLGYNNVVKVWEYDNLTYELVNVGDLIGHGAILLAVDSVADGGIVVTGDQKGIVKMWDLREFRCFQTIKIGTKEIRQFLNIDDILVIGDNRLNVVLLQTKNHKPHSEQSYLCFCLSNPDCKTYLFTSTSCLLISMQTGQIQQIFVICGSQQQITQVQRLHSLFCIGTNRGNIIVIDTNFANRKIIKAHQNQIVFMKADFVGGWMISVGCEGKIVLWVLGGIDGDCIGVCKVLEGVKFGEGVGLHLQVSAVDWLIGMMLADNQICLIDFQTFKVCEKIVFQNKITTFKFHPVSNTLIVFLQNSSIQLLSYKKQKLDFTIIQILHMHPQTIFNFTNICTISQQQSTTVTKCIINSFNQLVCVTDKRTIQVYDIQKFFCNSGIHVSNNSEDKQEGNLFRPVKEKFQYFCKFTEQENREYMGKLVVMSQKMLKLKKHQHNLGNFGDVIQICENKEKCRLVLLDSLGQLIQLDYQNLQVVCRRRRNQVLPQLWTKAEINRQDLKNKLIQAIKINQKICNQQFRPQIQTEIELSKLNIGLFLSKLSEQADSNKILKQIPKNCKQKLKGSKGHSVFHSSSASLKIMQTQKRLRNSLGDQDQVNFRILALRRKYSDAMKLPTSLECNNDAFFMDPIRQRFSLGQNNQDENCQLFQQINQKFEKWKQEKRNRSLSILTFEQNSPEKRFQAMRKFSKLPAKQKSSKEESQTKLKIKIEQICKKKGKGSELVKKYFKRQYTEAMQNNK